MSYDVARPWQNVATLLHATLTQRNVSEDLEKHFLCPHKCCARGKTSQHYFGKHDHVSNVAATMCPCFAEALLMRFLDFK